ncbi:glycosyltransferase family 32 protein [Peribacillus sp. NPDC006672]|uniref:glycosyltransferase family 32 protein n=1 Tax=Peribacillus sp. NPDC006672 TaxID=3390606 RepID=UPI003D039638
MPIPKVIHYCWFGGNPLPPLAKICINSWKKNCPDFEIIEWNEQNFDFNCNTYVKEAYEAGKFAFVSDYVRLHALYHHGGVYMDTDVEVKKPLDFFLKHAAFTGCENENYCVTGIMATEKNHPWAKDLLDQYKYRHFILANGKVDTTPNTEIITQKTTEKYGWIPKNKYQVLQNGLHIYPFTVFCAKSFKTGKIMVTDETYTVHHFSGSWLSKTDKVKAKIFNFLGPNITGKLVKYKNKLTIRS